MTNNEIISKTQEFLKDKFSDDTSGHDYWHMHRVWRVAKHIAAKEGGDMLTVELAALLHDIADFKLYDDEEVALGAAREWLKGLGVEEATIEHVLDIARNISFKGANVVNKLTTLEGQIVFDADKLDALGAIGIARTFVYGGAVGRPIHEPGREVELHDTFEAYKKSIKGSTTINNFYERILLLKDRMFTKTGKELAQHRHEIIEEFLQEFLDEWDGKR